MQTVPWPPCSDLALKLSRSCETTGSNSAQWLSACRTRSSMEVSNVRVAVRARPLSKRWSQWWYVHVHSSVYAHRLGSVYGILLTTHLRCGRCYYGISIKIIYLVCVYEYIPLSMSCFWGGYPSCCPVSCMHRCVMYTSVMWYMVDT